MSTAPALPTYGIGVPVALGQIDREIKKLWEANGNTASRASLINLAIYSEGKASMERNTALIAQVTRNHACRAILIVAEPEATESNVQAWMSAHCHLTRAGGKQTCCEQITFLLEGPSRNLIPNIVFSHLDSDLPLYLWWQGEFPEPIDHQLWAWVDRLIYDSAEWKNPKDEFQQLRSSLKQAQGRTTLCDLNWTRSLYFRQALSLTFDNPHYLPLLSQLKKVEIEYGPGYRTTAQLLVGWLAAQLRLQKAADEEWLDPNGNKLTIQSVEKPGSPLSALRLYTREEKFEITREDESEFLHADITNKEGQVQRSLYPAGKTDSLGLLNEELQRGALHRVYTKALAVAEELF